VKISRKEAKESIYWLRLLSETNNFQNPDEVRYLIKEADELKNTFTPLDIYSK